VVSNELRQIFKFDFDIEFSFDADASENQAVSNNQGPAMVQEPADVLGSFLTSIDGLHQDVSLLRGEIISTNTRIISLEANIQSLASAQCPNVAGIITAHCPDETGIFKYFPKLPLELRTKIWQYALDQFEGRVITLAFIRVNTDRSRRGTFVDQTAGVRYPAVWLANRESRRITTKNTSLLPGIISEQLCPKIRLMTSDILWPVGERTTFDMPSFTELMEGQDGAGEDKVSGHPGPGVLL
jgi:hypothetical protein